MAYDEHLAGRIRERLAARDGVTERRMFGGLAFLVRGHMAVAASRSGGLLVRVDPADTEACLARPHAARMEMRGRSMDGWISVAPEGVAGAGDLDEWLERGVAYVSTLPSK
jgi:hypothetical protein